VPQGTQPAYDLLNARLAYEFMDGRAEVALWAKNLTDEGYFDFAFNLLPAGTLTRYYQLPRTFGAELSYRL
jgi:iron complex outermembrane receptor protein